MLITTQKIKKKDNVATNNMSEGGRSVIGSADKVFNMINNCDENEMSENYNVNITNMNLYYRLLTDFCIAIYG
jgi:hypothetical protein